MKHIINIINIFKKCLAKNSSKKYLTINIKKEVEYETELDYNNRPSSQINIYK
jgi:hypothetical protein